MIDRPIIVDLDPKIEARVLTEPDATYYTFEPDEESPVGYWLKLTWVGDEWPLTFFGAECEGEKMPRGNVRPMGAKECRQVESEFERRFDSDPAFEARVRRSAAKWESSSR